MDKHVSESKKVLPLYPANIDDILDKFGHLLHRYTNLPDRESIYANFRRTSKRLEVLFPLIEHPVHGKTGLYVIEKYDEAGYVCEYHYNWKIIIPRMGVQLHHISSWDNEPHDAPGTNPKFITKTEPHHHHHVPGNRRERTENYDVRSLEDAFRFVESYLISGAEYKPKDTI